MLMRDQNLLHLDTQHEDVLVASPARSSGRFNDTVGMAVSPQGRSLVTLRERGTLEVRDIVSGKQVQHWALPEGLVRQSEPRKVLDVQFVDKDHLLLLLPNQRLIRLNIVRWQVEGEWSL